MLIVNKLGTKKESFIFTGSERTPRGLGERKFYLPRHERMQQEVKHPKHRHTNRQQLKRAK